MTKKKKLVYSKDQVIKDLYIGMCLKDLTISGRIYKEISRSWFGKLKTKYTYTISVPFMENHFTMENTIPIEFLKYILYRWNSI